MAVRTSHIALTLRGDRVEEGIEIDNHQIPFRPGSGMVRHDPGMLACASTFDGKLEKVHVAIVEEGVVLVPCEENPQRELVLVQQYSPGCGAKRWPGFGVNFGPEVRQLSSFCTSGGSGGAIWVLVSAPLGYAANIASQFINERDQSGQIISYKPELDSDKEEILEPEDDNSDGLSAKDLVVVMNRRWNKF